ncbi:hypothetical protein QYR55_08720 [Streptococcus iniae]|uniref:hypothetical protein n=1 Tax=Streptococcus iniae TaxID=1346 RepID=UPI002B2B957B|nr:hypothetical protein QYR55_08720 [Streptococcus iniae]
MDIIKSEPHNVACLEKMATKEELISLVLGSEKQIFVDGLYKNGPTMISISMSGFRSKEPQKVKVYIPVNIEIEANDSFSFIEHLVLENTVVKRLSLEDNLDKAILDMKEFSKVNGYEVVEDLLYMTFTSVYGEYWIDLQLVVEEV